MTKYCRYHRNNGHTTDKIEELVRVGHFHHFIRRDDHPTRSDHRRPPHDSRHNKCPSQPTSRDPQPAHTDIALTDHPLCDTINIIYGGFARRASTS